MAFLSLSLASLDSSLVRGSQSTPQLLQKNQNIKKDRLFCKTCLFGDPDENRRRVPRLAHSVRTVLKSPFSRLTRARRKRWHRVRSLQFETPKTYKKDRLFCKTCLFGDPDENRTRVTAVKGRCLNRLTTGPYMSTVLRRITD